METPRNWGAVDPTTIEGFDKLGERERRAVSTAISGLARLQRTGLLPPPMRVRITEANSFDLRGFAGTLHSVGVGIAQSLREDESGALIFQPTPYNQNLKQEAQPQSRARLNKTDQILEDLAAGGAIDPDVMNFLRSLRP